MLHASNQILPGNTWYCCRPSSCPLVSLRSCHKSFFYESAWVCFSNFLCGYKHMGIYVLTSCVLPPFSTLTIIIFISFKCIVPPFNTKVGCWTFSVLLPINDAPSMSFLTRTWRPFLSVHISVLHSFIVYQFYLTTSVFMDMNYQWL